MSQFTYAELFAGAGGLSMGLELAGWKPVAHAEIEPHARAVLRHHWPECRLDGDVSAINGADYAGVTLLSGGSPCQDLSIAGKRNGMAEGSGTRSSLYFEQVRIWNESGAPYFLWENVLGAFSSNNGRDFAAVLSALVGAAVPVPSDGWESAGVAAGPTGVAAWRVLDCQFFGPPQRRRRVFVLGARTGGVDPAEVLAVGEGLCRDFAEGIEAGQDAPRDARNRAGAAGDAGGRDVRGVVVAADAGDGVDVTRGQGRVATTQYGDIAGTLPARGDGSACADRGPNLVVVAIDMRNATRTTEKDEQNRQGSGIGEVGDTSPTLTGLFTPAVVSFDNRPHVNRGGPVDTLTTEGARNPLSVVSFAQNQLGEVRASSSVVGALSTNGNASGRAVPLALTYDARGNGDGQTVNTMAGDHQNLVTDYTAIVMAQAQTYRMTAFGEYADDGTASTIKARAGKDATDLAVSSGIPRRLMPVECERLMGWPDQHTATGVDEQGRTYALSDTARYRLCGNGVASPVAGWIAWRIRWVIEAQLMSVAEAA